MKFQDIKFETMEEFFDPNAIRALVEFPNGYRASIVRHVGSYGGKDGLFELAVMDSQNQIVYDTPVTDDVLGWLSPDEVEEAVKKVEALPSRPAVTVRLGVLGHPRAAR